MAFDAVRDLGAIVEEHGLKWAVVNGSKHYKFMVEGRFVCVVGRKTQETAASRGHKNNRADVNNACEVIKAERLGIILPSRMRGQR